MQFNHILLKYNQIVFDFEKQIINNKIHWISNCN